MNEKDILLIINPNSSKGKGKKKAQLIEKIFEENERDCDIAYTERPQHAIELAKKGAEAGYKTIIAAGGDGTVNEVCNGIMLSGKTPTMGIIPIGRGNDFAWMIKVPKKLKEACRIILEEKAEIVDVGFSKGGNYPEGVYFLNGEGFGFEPMINFKASSYKNLNGMPSYIAGFIYLLMHAPKPYKIKLTTDSGTRELETQQISVCNGERMGSSFHLGPNAIIDDGLLELSYAKEPIKSFGLFKLALRFLFGTHLKSNKIFYERITHLTVESEKEDLQIHVDGEVVSYGTDKCEINIIPAGIKIHFKKN